MRNTWQWKPNQVVVHYHRHGGRRTYPALAVIGAVITLLIIIAAVAGAL